MNRKLVLATRNPDKVREIQELLADLDVDFLTLDGFSDAPEVDEDGDTLEANALKKATAIARHTGQASVADDTGLEVDFLNGAPGVYSSRYAGENASYADNVRKLLSEMDGVPDGDRNARFRCVVAFVHGNQERTVDGVCEGRICRDVQGSEGFGYDPVFRVTETGLTFAEMGLVEKNKISHRAKAFMSFKEMYQAL